jgi:uncharacterized membrane protein
MKYTGDNMSKTYQIRFNTTSTDDSNRWRLITQGEEILVANIYIDAQTYTSKDYIEGLGDKWHITATGILELKDGNAYITPKRPDNALKRHIYKTITYRIFGTLVTFLGALYLGASFSVAAFLGVGELFVKPLVYFIHERIWYKFGNTSRNKKNR